MKILEALERYLRRILTEVEGWRQFLEQRQAQRGRADEGYPIQISWQGMDPPMPKPAPQEPKHRQLQPQLTHDEWMDRVRSLRRPAAEP